MEILQKKTGIILLFVAGLLLMVLLALSGKEKKDKSSEQGQENVYTEVPDGNVDKVTDSKTDVYMSYRAASSDINDYWDNCEEELIIEEELEQKNSGGGASQATSAELFGSDTPAPSRSQSSGGSRNTYRETPEQREARHQKRREEAIELADRMQRGPDADKPAEAEEPIPQTINIPSETVHRSEVISSLGDWSDGSVSSLDETHADICPDEMHPFKCMFVREEKIKHGQRVSVRLLEDIVVGGQLVPKNTHIMASCSIGSRLDLEITNIEMQGRILSLGYEAYDTDGVKGIYCPDVGSAGKTVKSHGTSLAGTALSSRIGRLASDIVSTGVSLAQSASGERTVTVPAGYTFYIVKKRQP